MAYYVKQNNASSLVVGTLSASATTLNVTPGEGANFPSSFPYLLTIWTGDNPGDDSGMEIVRCTGRTTDALTIVRAQESTGDVEHSAGEYVAMLTTAGLFNDATYGVEGNLDTHIALPNAHHNESHDIDSHTGTSLAIDDLTEDTADHGIDIEGINLKDNGLKTTRADTLRILELIGNTGERANQIPGMILMDSRSTLNNNVWGSNFVIRGGNNVNQTAPNMYMYSYAASPQRGLVIDHNASGNAIECSGTAKFTGNILVDTISESTADNGITIEGLMVEDSGLQLANGGVLRYTGASDSDSIYFNYYGYNGGATYFRDFLIYNGKGSEMLRLDGSASTADFTANILVDSIDEHGSGGVTIETVNINSGLVDGLDCSGVAAGADVTADNAPQSHGNSLHTNRSRQILFNTVTSYTGSFGTSIGCSLDPSTDEKVNYVGVLPSDFVSIDSIAVLWTASSTGSGNWMLNLTSQYGAVGESYSAHESGDLSNVVAVPASGQYVNRSTTMSTILSSATANDIIGFWLFRDANHSSDTYADDIIVRGVLVTYTADM